MPDDCELGHWLVKGKNGSYFCFRCGQQAPPEVVENYKKYVEEAADGKG